MARHRPGTPKLVVESREVCISLLFMGIDSGESNLNLVVVQRGLGLRETWSFVDTSTEM
jgi:hypothetical protein